MPVVHRPCVRGCWGPRGWIGLCELPVGWGPPGVPPLCHCRQYSLHGDSEPHWLLLGDPPAQLYVQASAPPPGGVGGGFGIPTDCVLLLCCYSFGSRFPLKGGVSVPILQVSKLRPGKGSPFTSILGLPLARDLEACRDLPPKGGVYESQCPGRRGSEGASLWVWAWSYGAWQGPVLSIQAPPPPHILLPSGSWPPHAWSEGPRVGGWEAWGSPSCVLANS